MSLPRRENYRWFCPVATRWSDNDIYGHVNNVVYYSYFDSVVNRYLISEGHLDIQGGETAGFVVSSACDYHAPIAYPEDIEAGIRVEKLGRSSVRYGIALFREGRAEALAHGHFVHVFVLRSSNQSVAIPAALRSALEAIVLT